MSYIHASGYAPRGHSDQNVSYTRKKNAKKCNKKMGKGQFYWSAKVLQRYSLIRWHRNIGNFKSVVPLEMYINGQ